MSETTDNVLLVAITVIRRRSVVQEAKFPGQRQKTKAEDISAGRTFEATEAEAKELVKAGAARRATLDEQARLKGGVKAAEEDDGLEKKTVAELKALAEQRNIALPRDANTKAEIIAELRKAG